MSNNSSVSDNRFAEITDSNKAGILWIASLLAGVYALLSLALRSYIKRKCFGIDDWVCSAATIFGLASFVAIYVGLSDGLGKTSVRTEPALQKIGQAVFASRIALIFALSLSKASVAFLIKRLFSQDMNHHRALCDLLLAAIAVWTLASVIGVSVDCSPQGLVNAADPTCSRQYLRWRLIGVFDATTELLIVLLSGGLVWRLQMRLELKIRVILAFLFRIPLVAAAMMHIRYVHSMPATNLNLNIIPSLTIEQIQLAYALISATIPNLKSFIMSFDTAMMMDYTYRINSVSKSGSGRSTHGQRSSRKASTARNTTQNSKFSTQEEFMGRLRPDLDSVQHHTFIHHEVRPHTKKATADLGRESPEKTIRRDTHWKVEETFEKPKHNKSQYEMLRYDENTENTHAL